MAFGFADLPNLTISSGSTTSGTMVLFEDAYGLSITAPAALTSTAITLLVAQTSASGATFGTLQSGGSDVVLTAGKSLVVTPVPFRQLQLAGTAAETAARTFVAAKVFFV